MLKVILRKNIDRIGKAGEIISVKEGFARNFLIPQNLAFIATDDNTARVEKEKKQLEQKKFIEKSKAQELADKLSTFSCTINSEAHDDNLYGSITAQDIAKALEVENIKIDKSDVLLDAPIKKIGIYEVSIKLHPEVTTKIKVWIVKK